MAGKMSGSPFHVETPIYKYATEQSEVPVAKSEFNQTITRCTKCAYCYEKDHHNRICTNISGNKLGGNHCSGYLDIKNVPNILTFKNESLEKYYYHRNHLIIVSLITKLSNYRQGSIELVDFYYGKRWVFTGINQSYNKEDLFSLVRKMKGKHWSNIEHWDIVDSDIVIDMGGNPYKLKTYKREVSQGKHIGKKLPIIISIQDFRNDIVKMIRALSE